MLYLRDNVPLKNLYEAIFTWYMFCKNFIHDSIISISSTKTKFKTCRVVVSFFVQMVTKQVFGICGDENGEKAWHTLTHVMLKYCGCGLFHFCRRFGTLVL